MAALNAVLETGRGLPMEMELSRKEFLAVRNNALGLMREYSEYVPNQPGRIAKLLGDKAKPYWRATGKILWAGRDIDVIMRTNPKVDKHAAELEKAKIGIALKVENNLMIYVIGENQRDSCYTRSADRELIDSHEGTAMLAKLDSDFWTQLKLGLEWNKK